MSSAITTFSQLLLSSHSRMHFIGWNSLRCQHIFSGPVIVMNEEMGKVSLLSRRNRWPVRGLILELIPCVPDFTSQQHHTGLCTTRSLLPWVRLCCALPSTGHCLPAGVDRLQARTRSQLELAGRHCVGSSHHWRLIEKQGEKRPKAVKKPRKGLLWASEDSSHLTKYYLQP